LNDRSNRLDCQPNNETDPVRDFSLCFKQRERAMSQVISTKLVEARYNKESDARHEAMLAAWRSWRAAIINAMAARVEQVGTDWDQELELLHIEMDHCSFVLSALNGPSDGDGGDVSQP
jgi:hypothetical protein